jgi:hypothetical protein
MSTEYKEQKVQKFFVKDGDDDYVPRRPTRRAQSSTPIQPHKRCECGGKMKARGSMGVSGYISSKCKCGKRAYTKIYKGVAGLVECY